MAKRGRPAGSKNKPKEAAPKIGHNEDQSRALFFHHLAKVTAATAAVAEARSNLKKLFNTAMADGVTKADLEWAMRERDRDKNQSLAEAQRRTQIARWMNLPVGTQMSFLDEDRTPIADKAYEEGKSAGMSAKACISPHSPETEASRRWLEGWHAGQKVVHEIFLARNAAAPLTRPAPAAQPDKDMDDALAADAPSAPPAVLEEPDLPEFLDRKKQEEAKAAAAAAAPAEPEPAVEPPPAEAPPKKRQRGRGKPTASAAPQAEAAPDPRADYKLETEGEGPADLAPAPDPDWPDGKPGDVRPRFLQNGSGEHPEL